MKEALKTTVVILLLVIVFFVFFFRRKYESFIDSVKVLDMFKGVTPRDFVKALGSTDKITKTFIKYKIPQEHIKNPKSYPKIASYIYTQSQKDGSLNEYSKMLNREG